MSGQSVFGKHSQVEVCDDRMRLVVGMGEGVGGRRRSYGCRHPGLNLKLMQDSGFSDV